MAQQQQQQRQQQPQQPPFSASSNNASNLASQMPSSGLAAGSSATQPAQNAETVSGSTSIQLLTPTGRWRWFRPTCRTGVADSLPRCHFKQATAWWKQHKCLSVIFRDSRMNLGTRSKPLLIVYRVASGRAKWTTLMPSASTSPLLRRVKDKQLKSTLSWRVGEVHQILGPCTRPPKYPSHHRRQQRQRSCINSSSSSSNQHSLRLRQAHRNKLHPLNLVMQGRSRFGPAHSRTFHSIRRRVSAKS